MLAATDSVGRIWISATDDHASNADVNMHLETTEAIVAAHFAPWTDLLYLATQDGELIEIDAVNGRIMRRVSVARDGRASDFAISPDGSTMAVCTRGGVLILIDAQTLSVRRAQQLTEKQIRSICFHTSGRSVACVGDSGSVLMYDLHTNRAKTSELISTASLFDVAMHPGGHTFAIGNRHGTVYLVDSATLKPLCKLRGTGSVMALAFTPEGDRLVVSRLEQPPQIWNLTQLVRPLAAVRPTRDREVRAMMHTQTQTRRIDSVGVSD
ncbi:MAG: WD40 repeat domain-containing protein [Phycisphaerales bacterium]